MKSFKGFACALVSAAAFGTIPLFSLPVIAAGMSYGSILVVRFFLAAVLMGIALKVLKKSFAVTKKELLLTAAFSLCYTGTAFILFWSYRYITGGMAASLLFIYPVFVTLIMILRYKTPVSALTLISLITAVAGVFVISSDGSRVDARGVALAIAGAFIYALYIVGVNRTSLKNMENLKLTFYILLFSFFFTAAGNAMTGNFAIASGPRVLSDLFM